LKLNDLNAAWQARKERMGAHTASLITAARELAVQLRKDIGAEAGSAFATVEPLVMTEKGLAYSHNDWENALTSERALVFALGVSLRDESGKRHELRVAFGVVNVKGKVQYMPWDTDRNVQRNDTFSTSAQAVAYFLDRVQAYLAHDPFDGPNPKATMGFLPA
jgi:hypothetical protein